MPSDQSTAKSRLPRALVQSILCLVVLGLGGLVTHLLIAARSKPPVRRVENRGAIVEVVGLRAADVPVNVRGQGTVNPRVKVELTPEVSGKVISLHPSLVDGGFFKAEETLVTIDSSDYDVAVERAKADVERTRVALDLERAEADVARAEWEALYPQEEPPSPLVLRIPQIRQAEAELRAARADQQHAEHNRARTKLALPFNGRVLGERVDVGQYLTAGQSIATVYGTDVAEIRVPLEDEELQWFDLPAATGDPPAGKPVGVPVTVVAEFAGGRYEWDGRAVRTAGQIDPRSRLVPVIVEVEQPYARKGCPPLVPGMFVEVYIHGRTLAGVIPLPRHAVRPGGTVWLIDEDRLHIRRVEVVRMDRQTVYVSSGLADGDRVVVSSLDMVTDGMLVQPRETDGDQPSPVRVEASR